MTAIPQNAGARVILSHDGSTVAGDSANPLRVQLDVTGLGNATLAAEEDHTLAVAASTTPDTAGGALAITAGDAAADANGGALTLDAGAAGGTGDGGAVTIGGTNAESVAVGRTGKMTTVAGDLTVDGTADVTGAATFADTLDVTGAATLADNLDVTGDVTVGGDATVTGDLAAAGGFRQQVGPFFVTTAADQSAVGTKLGDTVSQTWVAPYAGSVMAASGMIDTAITGAGTTIKARVYKNGSLLNAALDLDFTEAGGEVKDYATAAKGAHTFAAGDELKVVYTTTTITNTPKLVVFLTVEC